MAGYGEKYYKMHVAVHRDWERLVGKDIFETFDIKSIIDLGCGIGSFLEGANEAGCTDMLGIEIHLENAQKYIVDSIDKYIQKGDITSQLNIERTFDCCISFEVAEHILPEMSQNFVKNLVKYSDKYIIFTAAPPSQPCRRHINLREKDFWMNLIEKENFSYQHELVEKCLERWKEFKIVPWYIFNNLMIFVKE